ncbi:MAG: RHS repeat-associated core domain-containing protein [Acidiferrobacter sp.]
MAYNAIDAITSKSQSDDLTEPSGRVIPQQKTSYAWTYAYTGPHPHAPTVIGERIFTYDADGNQTGWTNTQNGTDRTLTWDDENRIEEIQDNGHTDRYVYNATGRRIIKRGPQGITVYVNPWYTVRNGTIVTRCVYAGTVRLATILIPQDKRASTQGSFPGQGLSHRSEEGTLHGQNTAHNPHLSGASTNKSAPGTFIYYYHPDHLGSTADVTDQHAKLYEALAYFPFGETWIDRGPNTHRIPYRYTAQTLDQDTKLYYYGARYYDPRTSVWQSPDPILGQYLNGQHDGGVYNPGNLAFYSYGYQNPIRYVDPNGDNPGAVYFPGFFPEANYRSQNPVTNVALTFVNTALNTANSLANGSLLVAGAVGRVAQPFVGPLISAETGTRTPLGEAAAGATTDLVQGLSRLGRLDRAGDGLTYQTYTKTNPDTGEVYSGRTSGDSSPEANIARRDASHHMNNKGYGPAQLDKSSTNAAAIRGREQQLIESNGGAKSMGGTSGNAINSISPTNPNKEFYMTQAKKELGR